MRPARSIPEVIPEQTVEIVWREGEKFSPDQAREAWEHVSRSQPALYEFLITYWKELGPDAYQMGAYMFIVIVQMFEMHFGKRLQSVSSRPMKSILQENVLLFGGVLRPGKDKALLQASKEQPWVWKYFSRCVLESDHPGTEVSQAEEYYLALMMKTVIDVLNSSVLTTQHE